MPCGCKCLERTALQPPPPKINCILMVWDARTIEVSLEKHDQAVTVLSNMTSRELIAMRVCNKTTIYSRGHGGAVAFG